MVIVTKFLRLTVFVLTFLVRLIRWLIALPYNKIGKLVTCREDEVCTNTNDNNTSKVTNL